LENLLAQLNILIRDSDGLNIYALMALFRIVVIAKEDFVPYSQGFGEAIALFVEKCIRESSTTPYPIYVLFETIGYVISYTYKLKNQNKTIEYQIVESYESQLLPIFNKIVEEGRTDIIGYVFQIYAAFIQFIDQPELSNTYAVIAKSVLEDPSNSDPEMNYLVPGYIRLLCAILYKHPNFLVNYTEHLFGLQEKVLDKLNLNEDAMSLFSAMIEVLPLDSFAEQIVSATKNVFKKMFVCKTKLRTKKIPDDLLKSVFIFMARFILNHSESALFDLCDQVQSGILYNFFEKEAGCIGRIGKSDFYRRHVLYAFTQLVTSYEGLKGTQARITIARGLIENICPTRTFEIGLKTSDYDEEFTVEYQEENKSFEMMNFTPLFSIEIYKEGSLPEVDNYTLRVLQAIEQVVNDESPDFLTKVGEQMTRDTQEYFMKLAAENNIKIG
jgi:hypothetical protein